MTAAEYFAEIEQQIETLRAALVAGSDMDDPGELRAEIARLQRLAD